MELSEENLDNLKVALVHDWLVGYGGGERILYDLHEMFPAAPIYTLVCDPDTAPGWIQDCEVKTTYIQKWPGARKHHKMLLSFMPKAWESVDLTEYDLVISTCSSCCKGIITAPEASHICYCFSPTRYLWDLYYEYLSSAGFLKRHLIPSLIHKVRIWDYLAAQRPDAFASVSDFIGMRISKYYRRKSTTVYPGIGIDNYPIQDAKRDYYLVVSRFVRYKRVDLAIEACKQLDRKLVVIGSGGEEEARLKSMAGPNTEFIEMASDEEVATYYANARAFLFPGLEDFGITPLEAMSAGVPVLAYGRGGALETIVDGETGLFFYDQNVQSLVDCILEFESKEDTFSPQIIHNHTRKFSSSSFKREMMALIRRTRAEKEKCQQ